MIRTPKNRGAYIAILVLLYLIQAVGDFLHNAAIYWRIPIPSDYHGPPYPYIGSLAFVEEMEVQAFILVLVTVLSAFPILKYSGNVSLLAWQRSRPFWSFAWSVVLTGIAVFLVYDAIRIYVDSGLSVGSLVGSMAFAVFLLLVRAEMVVIPNKPLQRTRLSPHR